MADFILRHKEFPEALQSSLAERLYLQDVGAGAVFSPFNLAQTSKVSVNPKTFRPYYLVHWASFDGSANLPLIYMATIEDSSPAMIEQLVGENGKLKDELEIPLPVDGLLNPELAHRFDDFTEKNSAYTLSPVTIATNLDKDFETLHPKQLRRVVLGPFYSAGITENNSVVTEVLSKVRKPENAWLLTWTLQEVYSKAEKPGRKGLWSSEKTTQEFHINTDDLEATRAGRFELRETCAGAARSLSGALRRRRGAEDLRRLQGPHSVQGAGDQRCVGSRSSGIGCRSPRTCDWLRPASGDHDGRPTNSE